MPDFARFLLALTGHCALHLAFYNRLNAAGLRRWKIKLIECVVAAEFFVVLGLMLYGWFGEAEEAVALKFYGYICIAILIAIGIPWLTYRPIFGIGWLSVNTKRTRYDLAVEIKPLPIGTVRCRINSLIPGNQILQLSVEEKTLPVSGLPQQIDQLRLAHISDVHLTGDMLPDFYRFVSDKLMAWNPDMVCLTGDIVDKDYCIPWLEECFGSINAQHGCFFILGNHDTRVAEPRLVRAGMEAVGWIDVGGKAITHRIGDEEIVICGNEMPWFEPLPNMEPHSGDNFRLLLSHSPDQISWARDNNIQLMLAGHTHGGHGRLPLVGPLLSPSWHGSRFASGEFYLKPTTLHVTRGIFGTHLQRINCPPELSLLNLQSPRS